MKNFISLVVIFLFFFSLSYAQGDPKNALGIRIENDDKVSTFGASISYQLWLSDGTRLEGDLGVRNGKNFDAFKVVGLFQWVMPLDKSFHWYVGVGAGAGSVKGEYPGAKASPFALIAGDVGIEYNFKIPLLLSLDLRPELGFGEDAYGDGFDFDLGIGIRYQF